uniref:Alpha-1,4-N-acetylglucosaminyltransferase-like isoform X2 n=1 Tax=Geotrypetes seraphini TaxID=260995 RepID=A0A6P8PB20_GEOSA|nr:alpha-1,4-N-acetylglucosaminyltransferase-like isoform X2 [Geotrypetes seraphini]XP_033772110.1 alpha-1,4-N-acetylglucosaminyltransferase-like isoform X2 [Geotrypetes seraphini]XP_033772117.1 alpha-1,4-N-acetylglucosaminyltransferase-like isoform X2 [Geotrypetes seraphini]XP_033772127.1 alpha-1,4-N-acetylglucosaminyltransferase-like isoform X2 [Geotrypetes seraphini]XP_033772134.1 alpha-1,4-N-acetylglucosaminyltransferase-like isoform X2 [Geotrypetes seraphini]XP_033772144.1 alpha-1,4-N-ace
MKLWITCSLFIFFFISSTFFWMQPLKTVHKFMQKQLTSNVSKPLSSDVIIKSNTGIFFVETTEKLEPSPLAVCAVESASQTYPDRTIYFFMKGLTKNMTITKSSFYKAIPLLSSMENVNILPLDLEEVVQDTPLYPWYQKVNPAKEQYWKHVSSDGFRLAVIWKYGGIYMDTDIVSLKPVQEINFLAVQDYQIVNSAILGFQKHHQFLWDCMEDFVKNYRGGIWGHQGPGLVTRMIERHCGMTVFKGTEDIICRDFSILNTQRFYPVPYQTWERYFQVWNPKDSFNNSYALHLWNFMNKNNKRVIIGSNSVVENLFMKRCPRTYELIIKHASRK